MGRNLATALNFLGHKPTFITALADDILGSFARAQLSIAGLADNQVKVISCCNGDEHRQIRNDEILNRAQEESNGSQASSCFAFVLIDSLDGQCEYVIADLECVKAINEKAINSNLETIKQASMLVIDANLSPGAIEYLIEICHQFEIPIFIEPTDKLALPNLVTCIRRVLHSNNPDRLRSILCLSPNALELEGILDLFEEEQELGGAKSLVSASCQQQQQPVQNKCQTFTKTDHEEIHTIPDEQGKIDDNHEKSSEKQMTVNQIEQMASRLMRIHMPQIKCLLVTMDKRGVLVALRSRSSSSSSSSSVGYKKTPCEKQDIDNSNNDNIEWVKLMDGIGDPLSEKVYIKHFKPLETIDQPISASGAGDSFAAGFISGLLDNQNLGECLDKAFKASQLALQAKDTISSKLTTLSSSSANN